MASSRHSPTSCNGCGGCCDPVVLGHTLAEIATGRTGIGPADIAFCLDALTPLSAREVRDKVAWIPPAATWDDQPLRFFYRCRHFDPDGRVCTRYEQRPPMCRVYPWPEGEARPGTALPPECSFRADIGQPVALLAARHRPGDQPPGGVQTSRAPRDVSST